MDQATQLWQKNEQEQQDYEVLQNPYKIQGRTPLTEGLLPFQVVGICDRSRNPFFKAVFYKILVSINQPFRSDGTKPYTIQRRYSQFQWLDNALKIYLPAIPVPPLCKKSYSDFLNAKLKVDPFGQQSLFLRHRQIRLQLYLNACQQSKQIAQSLPFISFYSSQFEQKKSLIDDQLNLQKLQLIDNSIAGKVMSWLGPKPSGKGGEQCQSPLIMKIQQGCQKLEAIRNLIHNRENLFSYLGNYSLDFELKALGEKGQSALANLNAALSSSSRFNSLDQFRLSTLPLLQFAYQSCESVLSLEEELVKLTNMKAKLGADDQVRSKIIQARMNQLRDGQKDRQQDCLQLVESEQRNWVKQFVRVYEQHNRQIAKKWGK